MKKAQRKVKVSACVALIKLQKSYLAVALHCLQEELSKEILNKEVVYCLCDYVASINKIISWFSILLDDVAGESFKITYPQALIAKSYMENFRFSKELLMHKYNIFVELN